MFIDELLEYFDSLKLTQLTRDQYRDQIHGCLKATREKMPHVPDNVEALRNIESIADLTDRILEFWSQQNKTVNPLRAQENKLIANHDFFKNRSYVCAAPYTSLRFDVGGKMTVCCNNTDYPIGMYPEQTPLQAWTGTTMQELRQALDNYDFSKGCQQCAKFILAGNAYNTVLVSHDKIIPDVKKSMLKEWPSHIVFQHNNTCNYECIMCGGNYSSLIARNRDRIPQVNPYNTDQFLKDIEPFVANATVFEFLGGEPFLITQHYKIWEVIKEKNPTATVNIISNGSVLNSKVEQLLSELPHSCVHVSLDAVTPEIYAYIRRNGNIESVKNNIRRFKQLNKLGSVSVCPMIQNIRDIPNVIKFCEEVGADLWFNDVQYALGDMWEDTHENGTSKRKQPLAPAELPAEKIKEFRLWMLPKNEIQGHAEFLKNIVVSARYKARLDSFINYLQNYVQSLN